MEAWNQASGASPPEERKSAQGAGQVRGAHHTGEGFSIFPPPQPSTNSVRRELGGKRRRPFTKLIALPRRSRAGRDALCASHSFRVCGTPASDPKRCAVLASLCSAMAARWEVERWVRCGAQRPQGSTGTKDSKNAHNASLPALRSYASPWNIGHFPISGPCGSHPWNARLRKGRRGFGPHAPVRFFALSPFSKSCERRRVSLCAALRQPAARAGNTLHADTAHPPA